MLRPGDKLSAQIIVVLSPRGAKNIHAFQAPKLDEHDGHKAAGYSSHPRRLFAKLSSHVIVIV